MVFSQFVQVLSQVQENLVDDALPTEQTDWRPTEQEPHQNEDEVLERRLEYLMESTESLKRDNH